MGRYATSGTPFVRGADIMPEGDLCGRDMLGSGLEKHRSCWVGWHPKAPIPVRIRPRSRTSWNASRATSLSSNQTLPERCARCCGSVFELSSQVRPVRALDDGAV